MDNKNDDDEIDHSFAYYKCSEKVGQNIPRFLEAPFVRMLRMRSASLKTMSFMNVFPVVPHCLVPLFLNFRLRLLLMHFGCYYSPEMQLSGIKDTK